MFIQHVLELEQEQTISISLLLYNIVHVYVLHFQICGHKIHLYLNVFFFRELSSASAIADRQTLQFG